MKLRFEQRKASDSCLEENPISSPLSLVQLQEDFSITLPRTTKQVKHEGNIQGMFAKTSANPNRKVRSEKLERLHEEIDTFFYQNL